MSDRNRPPRLDPRDEDTAATRAAYGPRPWGRQMRRPYYQYLPESPVGRMSRDRARWYLAKVIEVREMDCWSASEQEGLRRLQRKWEHRAAGRDARFNAIGVVAGINNRFRPRTGADALANIQRAIAESNARLDGTQGVQPGLLHVYDKKWPMGRPVVKG